MERTGKTGDEDTSPTKPKHTIVDQLAQSWNGCKHIFTSQKYLKRLKKLVGMGNGPYEKWAPLENNDSSPMINRSTMNSYHNEFKGTGTICLLACLFIKQIYTAAYLRYCI